MLNLFKTDLRRIFKDKLFLVAFILSCAFSLFTPLLNHLLFSVLLKVDGELFQALGMNAKTLFFSSFAPGNNLGLVLPVLLTIALCKDFSYGTVRNKIISGKSRVALFLSLFMTCTVVTCLLMFLHAFLTLGVSLLFFDYQATPFLWKDFGYLMASLGFELLIYVFISALVSFLCVFMKNAGVAVVMYVAANFLFSIVGSIVAVARTFVDPAQKALTSILKFLDQANIFMGTYVGITESYTWQGVLPILVCTVGGTALFLLLGITAFRKKDLK